MRFLSSPHPTGWQICSGWDSAVDTLFQRKSYFASCPSAIEPSGLARNRVVQGKQATAVERGPLGQDGVQAGEELAHDGTHRLDLLETAVLDQVPVKAAQMRFIAGGAQGGPIAR
jgi:hypothetical protein